MQIVRYECDNCGAVSEEINLMAETEYPNTLPADWHIMWREHLCSTCADIARTAANDALAATWNGKKPESDRLTCVLCGTCWPLTQEGEAAFSRHMRQEHPMVANVAFNSEVQT